MSAKLTITIPEWLDKVCASPLVCYRQWKYGYSFRRINIGEGQYTIVEPRDYYWIGKYKWILMGTKYNLYAVREAKIGPKETKRVYLHREIMKFPKRKFVDHRNGDGLDNRRENLRLATQAQNNYNRRKTSKKTLSQFRGISFDKNSPAWVGCIHYKGKRINLGRFKNEIDAAHAYDRAAKKYHKEFAKLNFPERSEAESCFRTESPKGAPRCVAKRSKSAGGRFGCLANWLGARPNFPKEDYSKK